MGGFLFFLFCAPIITIPAAFTGLMAAVAPLFAPAEGDTIGRFWRGFRRTFGRSLLLGLLNLLAAAVLYADIAFFWAFSAPWGRYVAYLFGALALLAGMINVFAWPLLAWFPQPLGKLLRRSFMLSAVHPFTAIGALLGTLVLPALFLVVPGLIKGLIVIMFPGVTALIVGGMAWRAMKRYAGPDEEIAE